MFEGITLPPVPTRGETAPWPPIGQLKPEDVDGEVEVEVGGIYDFIARRYCLQREQVFKRLPDKRMQKHGWDELRFLKSAAFYLDGQPSYDIASHIDVSSGHDVRGQASKYVTKAAQKKAELNRRVRQANLFLYPQDQSTREKMASLEEKLGLERTSILNFDEQGLLPFHKQRHGIFVSHNAVAILHAHIVDGLAQARIRDSIHAIIPEMEKVPLTSIHTLIHTLLSQEVLANIPKYTGSDRAKFFSKFSRQKLPEEAPD